jgi:hypothetical protein
MKNVPTYMLEKIRRRKTHPMFINVYIKKPCNEEFSLYFLQPCKDTCQKYAMLNQKIILFCNTKQKRDLKQQHDIHLKMLN